MMHCLLSLQNEYTTSGEGVERRTGIGTPACILLISGYASIHKCLPRDLADGTARSLRSKQICKEVCLDNAARVGADLSCKAAPGDCTALQLPCGDSENSGHLV